MSTHTERLLSEGRTDYSIEDAPSGDKLFNAIRELIYPKLDKVEVNWQSDADQISDKSKPYVDTLTSLAEGLSNTLFNTLVSNLCHRIPGEFYELHHSEREHTYLDLYDSVAAKWSDLSKDKHKELFLDLAFYQVISHVLTPHPTLMLHNDVVADERRVSELMHSQEFLDWQNNDFPYNHHIIAKLTKELNRLNKSTKTKFLYESLRNDQEVVRSAKFSERIYDMIPEVLNALYEVAEKRGFEITDEDFYKYIAPRKFVDVASWPATDQDGKKNARPYFIEEKLLPTSERAIDQEYINDFIKIYTGLNNEKFTNTLTDLNEKQQLRSAISEIALKLLNNVDTNNETFFKFYSKTPEAQESLLDEDENRNFDEKETPNIARQIRRLKKAIPEGRYDLTAEVVQILEEAIDAKKQAIENNNKTNLKGFEDYRGELIGKIQELDEKFGSKVHKYHGNGKEYKINPFKVLASQVGNFGDKALSPQVRQNCADIEDSNIYVINEILDKKEIALPEYFQTTVDTYKQRKQADEELGNSVNELRKHQIEILKPSVQNKEELENKIAELKTKISDQQRKSSELTDKLDGLGNQCLTYMASDNGRSLRDRFKRFVSDREVEGKDFRIKISEPDKVAAKLGASLEEVEAYDRQKTVALMVNKPEVFTECIAAENRSQFTRFAMQMNALGQVEEGQKVEVRILGLTESKEGMQSGTQNIIKAYDNPYVFQQLKDSTKKEIYRLNKDGKKTPLYAEGILAEMGFTDEEIDKLLKERGKKRGEIKIETEAYEMLSNSDMTKVQSSSGSIFLQADFQYECTIEAALRGVKMVWYKGQGSGMHRSAPQEAVERTVQGREAMMSSEGYFLRTMKSSVKYTMEKLGLKSQFAKEKEKYDPRFNFANDDYYTFRFITRNKEKWEQLKSIFVESGNPEQKGVGEAYSELYESGEFQKYYTHASAFPFMKIVTFSARQVVKTGTGASDVTYPQDTDPRTTRAIQFGQSVSAIIPHGGTEIFHAFIDKNGKYDITKMNDLVNLFKENEDFKRCPALQELFCKNALMLASADLRSAWKYVGFERTGPGSAGYIEIEVNRKKDKIKISEIGSGRYDEMLKRSLKDKGYYSEHEEPKQNQLIEDELVAIKVLAKLDVDTVKSRNAMAAIFTAIRENRQITSRDFKKENRIDSKKVILDALPYLASHERIIANDYCSEAHEALGYLHEEAKIGALPKISRPQLEKDAHGKNKPKFLDLLQELTYRVAYYAGVILYENNERNPTAVIRTHHAQAVEESLAKKNRRIP